MRVMIIGASGNRSKYGNKAVRAYARRGHDVLAVNPKEIEVEGIPSHRRVADPPGPIDRAVLYVPPEGGMELLDEIAARGDVAELWVSPGAESEALMQRARDLGLEPVNACAMMDIGEAPI